MQTQRTKQGYVSYGEHKTLPNRRSRAPLDALSFPAKKLSEHFSGMQDTAFLKKFIDSIPDEMPGEEMRKFLDSLDSLDDAIVEKLIIEEL